MKEIRKPMLCFAALSVVGAATSAQAQTKPASPLRYQDSVEANPTADADIKVVTEYINTLVGGSAETLYREQQLGVNEIAQRLRISKVTLYKYLRHRGVVIHSHRKAAAAKTTA